MWRADASMSTESDMQGARLVTEAIVTQGRTRDMERR